MPSEKHYLSIINNLFDGVYFVNKDRRIILWNNAAERITGYKSEEIVGQCCQNNILNHIDCDGRSLCLLGCPLFATIIDGRQRKDTVFLLHKKGHRVSVFINTFPIMQGDDIIGAVEVFKQNSSKVNDTDYSKIEDVWFDDSELEFTNHEKIENYILYRLNELKKFRRKFCVVSSDIDNFDESTYIYGHEAMESLLRNIYKSIKYNINPSDFFCHRNGDGFIGIFEIKNNYEATLLAEKIRILTAGSELPHDLHNLSITASLGVTVARKEDTVDSILQRAEILMHQSMVKKTNCVSSDA